MHITFCAPDNHPICPIVLLDAISLETWAILSGAMLKDIKVMCLNAEDRVCVDTTYREKTPHKIESMSLFFYEPIYVVIRPIIFMHEVSYFDINKK